MMTELRHMQRRPVTEKQDRSMSVISFKQLDWTDLIVNITDISPQGAGIEGERRIDPGFVWFPDTIDGRKGGLLMWSKQHGTKYRGGVRFVSISPVDEESVQEKIAGSGPMKDPAIVIETILESLKKNGPEARWDPELDL
jgi:hypothetical protein